MQLTISLQVLSFSNKEAFMNNDHCCKYGNWVLH